jgi:type II secretory pathway pseudopilin PulG
MRGFTLIETLVALVLFEVGLLALLAITAVAARDLAAAHRTTRAQMLATNRLELLRARGCPAQATANLPHPGGYSERWSIEGTGPRRIITVVIVFALPRARLGRVALRGDVLCSA